VRARRSRSSSTTWSASIAGRSGASTGHSRSRFAGRSTFEHGPAESRTERRRARGNQASPSLRRSSAARPVDAGPGAPARSLVSPHPGSFGLRLARRPAPPSARRGNRRARCTPTSLPSSRSVSKHRPKPRDHRQPVRPYRGLLPALIVRQASYPGQTVRVRLYSGPVAPAE
jgi:hypothetical protein